MDTERFQTLFIIPALLLPAICVGVYVYATASRLQVPEPTPMAARYSLSITPHEVLTQTDERTLVGMLSTVQKAEAEAEAEVKEIGSPHD